MTFSDRHQPAVRAATPGEMPLLAAALGDTPETVISHHLLTTGACNAWYTGDVRQPRAIAVQALAFPAEPTLFGETADAVIPLISQVTGWTTFSVPLALARELERPIATVAGTLSINTLEDVYHVLDGPLVEIARHPDVRLLPAEDRAMLDGLPQLAPDTDHEPIVAAAIVEDEIVSVAHAFAWSPGYVDIGVTTHEEWRGQGLATSAAALVAAEVRARGQVPVWSCGAHNEPSLRIAARLGFRETSRRLYIIPQRSASSPDSR